MTSGQRQERLQQLKSEKLQREGGVRDPDSGAEAPTGLEGREEIEEGRLQQKTEGTIDQVSLPFYPHMP